MENIHTSPATVCTLMQSISSSLISKHFKISLVNASLTQELLRCMLFTLHIFEYCIDTSIGTFLLQSVIIICKDSLFGNLLFCAMAYHMVKIIEHFICIRKKCVFCSCLDKCLINFIQVKVIENVTSVLTIITVKKMIFL